jgi:hypothetical protein
MGIIGNKLWAIMMNLKQVRNGLAHKWKEAEVNYKGKKTTQKLYTIQACPWESMDRAS